MIRTPQLVLAWIVAIWQILMAVYWLFLAKIVASRVEHRFNSLGAMMVFGLLISACIAGYSGYLLLSRRRFTPIVLITCLYTFGLTLYGLFVAGREMHGWKPMCTES